MSDNLNVITFDTTSKKKTNKKKETDTPFIQLNQHQQLILNNLIKKDVDRLEKKKYNLTQLILNSNSNN